MSLRLLTFLCATHSFALPVAAGGNLAASLSAALEHPGLRGAEVGALVARADDGRTLFEQHADALLLPASNAKILTALAALATFGPTHCFKTRVYADTQPDASGAVTTLVVRGGGDPALTSEEWWRLAGDLRRQGLRRVRGDILLDDSHYDRQRWNPAWGAVSSRAYHAPVGALSANYGSFAVDVQPGAHLGDPPRITLEPSVPYLRLVDQTRAASAKGRPSLQVNCRNEGDFEHVVVSGALPAAGKAVVFHRSVADPLRYAAAVFRMQLQAHGIAAQGRDRPAPLPPGYHELLAFEGKPLAEIVRLLMKHSNNNIAESLVKAMAVEEMGEPGTWENGLRAMRGQLVALGLDPSTFTLVDGSGLASTNRVSARALVEALRIASRSFLFGPEFISSLPIAARDGTLGKRAKGATDAVRAKTGLLARATALSGYARLKDGVDAVFSVLVNGYQRTDQEATAAVDGFIAALVNSAVAGANDAPPEKLDGPRRRYNIE